MLLHQSRRAQIDIRLTMINQRLVFEKK